MNSTRRLTVEAGIAAGIVLLVVTVLVVLASVVRVASASIAPGTIAVEGAPQEVQADRIGTIAAIHVHNGDQVAAGDIVLELDTADVKVASESLKVRLAATLIRSERLQAQSLGASTYAVPAEVATLIDDGTATSLSDVENRLFAAASGHVQATLRQLQSQVRQLELQTAGLNQTIAKMNSSIAAVDTAIEDAAASDVGALRVERSSIEAERQVASSQLPQLAEAIVERGAQIEIARRAGELDALSQLDQARNLILDLRDQLQAAQQDIEAALLRAPSSGVVLDSVANTPGEVVQPSQTLMLIVPEDERLFVEARLAPPFIDAIREGDDVRVRFSTLDSATTPELAGVVERIAPSTTQDPTTGETFYSLKILIEADEIARLPTDVAVGMPAEALIEGADRSIIDYLLRPIADQMARVFIER